MRGIVAGLVVLTAVTAARGDENLEEAKRHFAAEEGLMDSYRLPAMGAHKVAHHALLAGIDGFRNELLGDTPYLALPQMRDWLLDHIQHEDAQLAEILEKQGFEFKGNMPAKLGSA